jgi:hypothetical protein
MKITPEKWEHLRESAAADDQERFEKLLIEAARIAVAHERSHQQICHRAREREYRGRRYFAFDR